MANERLTEKLFRDELIKHNITDERWIIEEQQSKNGLLNFKSKAGTENSGYPEFIITNKEVDDFVIIVECKASNNDMVKYTDDNDISTDIKDVQKYAINGAYHYAKAAAENFNVIFIGVTGETPEDFNYEFNFLNKNELEASSLIIGLEECNNIQDVINKANGDLTSLQDIHRKSKNLAADIHEFLRDKCGVSNNEKAQLIAGILLALDSDDFNMDLLKSYDTTDEKHSTDGSKILEYAIQRATETEMEKHKCAKLESAFSFISTHTQLNNRDIGLGMSPIKRLCQIISGKATYQKNVDEFDLFNAIKNHQAYDVLGNFYSEFVSYNGSDGNGLGIVLTPSHVTEMMVKLIDVTKDDVLYDPCTGTGGFLVAGLNKVIEEVKHDTNLTNNDRKTSINEVKQNNFIGCEIQDHMYSIAGANMILRGDGKSHLYPISCFKLKTTLKTGLDKKITRAVLNPPYSQKEKEFKELKFVEHALDVTEKNGLVSFIVPKSCFLDKNKKLRKAIMEKHTLEAVISMPKDLFHGSAGTEVAVGVFKAGVPHNPEIKTWLCEFDDGFKVEKHKGRLEQGPRLNKVLTNKLIKHYKNKEIISGYSTTANINLEDECLYDCHIPTERPTQDDFKRKLKDYLTFEFENKIKEVINE